MMIKRNIINKLQPEISQPEIDILLGPRQVGKTTLLKQLKTFAEKSGKQVGFFDLEQPQVLAEFNLSDTDVTDKVKNAGQIIFIDEFQYIKNAWVINETLSEKINYASCEIRFITFEEFEKEKLSFD